jgi:CsoR family transcriptional regulator, copper-sensing transcriptional repressor
MKTLDYSRVQTDLIQRLKRIEGQVRGIQKMVDEKRACEDILVQLMAVRAALDTVTAQLVVGHTSQCMEQMPSEEA